MADDSSSGISAWLKSHLPTREGIATNRWTRPFAKHLLKPDLWRFNRRSVPMAVAVGLLVGPIVPVAHTVFAALLAVPVRANIVIAVVTTWLISNPATWLPLYGLAGRLGNWLLNTQDKGGVKAFKAALDHGWSDTLTFVLHEGRSIALGVVVISILLAMVGYLCSSLLWRLKIGRDWRRRSGARKA
jgi:uncharacterized protein